MHRACRRAVAPERGHEVFSVYEEARGMDDHDIVQKAFAENWILVTNDKDFGERIYRERQPHRSSIGTGCCDHIRSELAGPS